LEIEALLLRAGRPMDLAALARGFRNGGRRIEPAVAQAVRTLLRYGRVYDLGSGRYAARLAA
jgi:hypothetical protein